MKTLVDVLQTDKSGDVREEAASAIGGRFLKQAPDYISALTERLKDEHLGTRIAVAVALRNLGESAKPAFPALFDAAKDPKENPQVRASARQGQRANLAAAIESRQGCRHDDEFA